MSKSKIKQRLAVYKRRLLNNSPKDHKSYAIPRNLPEQTYYSITFKKPLNVRFVDSRGYVLIDPAEIDHTIGYCIKEWMIFLYKGRRCGLPFNEFIKLRDGCLLTMKEEKNPGIQAFNEKKRKNFNFPKHEPQNAWETKAKWYDPIERLRRLQRNEELTAS